MSALPKIIDVDSGAMVPMADVPAQTPMAMLDRALERGMDVETIKGLMDLQRRWERAEAEKAYNEAFSAFKAEAVSIVRGKKVTAGPLIGKSYAELYSFVDEATPALSKHGLSASWKIKDEKDWIDVTCVLKHVNGHSESVTMGGPPDAGGAKNPIQARASTVTYLQRYTFKAITGLAEKDEDTDGASTSRGMPEDVLAGWVKKIKDTTTKVAAKEACAEAIKVADSFNDLTAYKDLKETLKEHNEFIDKAGK